MTQKTKTSIQSLLVCIYIEDQFGYLQCQLKARLNLYPSCVDEFVLFPARADGEDMGQCAQQREGDLD